MISRVFTKQVSADKHNVRFRSLLVRVLYEKFVKLLWYKNKSVNFTNFLNMFLASFWHLAQLCAAPDAGHGAHLYLLT